MLILSPCGAVLVILMPAKRWHRSVFQWDWRVAVCVIYVETDMTNKGLKLDVLIVRCYNEKNVHAFKTDFIDVSLLVLLTRSRDSIIYMYTFLNWIGIQIVLSWNYQNRYAATKHGYVGLDNRGYFYIFILSQTWYIFLTDYTSTYVVYLRF